MTAVSLTVVLTPPRIEYLRHLEEISRGHDALIIEGPEVESFWEFLRGKIRVDEYLYDLELEYPEFTRELYLMAKRVNDCGVKVIPLDPYQTIAQEIKVAAIMGRLKEHLKSPINKYVALIELSISRVLREYYMAMLARDFERLVDLTIRFARLDAERIRFRCELRARRLSELVRGNEIRGRVAVHAYHLHDVFVKYLRNKINTAEISVVDLREEVAKRLGVRLPPHPGRELTLSHVHRRRMSRDEEMLLAARSLIHVSMMPKRELRPSEENKYPHLKKDLEILTFVNSLDYEGCRRYYLESICADRSAAR